MSDHERDWVLLALSHGTRDKGWCTSNDVCDILTREFGWNPESGHISEVLDTLSQTAVHAVRKGGDKYRTAGKFFKRRGII